MTLAADAQQPAPAAHHADAKLLGDASTGDIATLSWSGDYRAELVGEEPCQPNEQARQCLHLSLHATRKGSDHCASSHGWANPPRTGAR